MLVLFLLGIATYSISAISVIETIPANYWMMTSVPISYTGMLYSRLSSDNNEASLWVFESPEDYLHWAIAPDAQHSQHVQHVNGLDGHMPTRSPIYINQTILDKGTYIVVVSNRGHDQPVTVELSVRPISIWCSLGCEDNLDESFTLIVDSEAFDHKVVCYQFLNFIYWTLRNSPGNELAWKILHGQK